MNPGQQFDAGIKYAWSSRNSNKDVSLLWRFFFKTSGFELPVLLVRDLCIHKQFFHYYHHYSGLTSSRWCLSNIAPFPAVLCLQWPNKAIPLLNRIQISQRFLSDGYRASQKGLPVLSPLSLPWTGHAAAGARGGPVTCLPVRGPAWTAHTRHAPHLPHSQLGWWKVCTLIWPGMVDYFFTPSSWPQDSNALITFFQVAQVSLQRAGQVCHPLLGLSEDRDPETAARRRRCG